MISYPFADDIVIIAKNKNELQDILHCLEKGCKNEKCYGEYLKLYYKPPLGAFP